MPRYFCSAESENVEIRPENDGLIIKDLPKSELDPIRKFFRDKPYEPVDWETSFNYMNSDAYEQVYGALPVWHHYRRNFKGHFQPNRTRRSCVIAGKIQTANPCPLCRDDHLVLDYRNRDLLMQFINSVTLEVHPTSKTGLCIRQHKKLLLEYVKAVDLGTIPTRLPFVLYDYEDYYELSEDLKQLEGYQAYAELESKSDLMSQDLKSSISSKLPPNLTLLLQENQVIQHVREYTAETQDKAPTRPTLPNRYKMEEEHKARLLKRRRAKSVLIF